MSESIELSASWGPRGEPVEDAAARLGEFLAELTASTPSLGGWKRSQGSMADALRADPVALEPDSLEELLRDGLDRTADGSLSERGSLVSVWTGDADGPSATLDVRCGSTRPRIPNSVRIVAHPSLVPDDGRDVERVRALARAWAPDGALVGSSSVLDQQPARPWFGWVTYLAAAPRPVPYSSVIVEEVEGGTVVRPGSGRSATPAEVADIRTAYLGLVAS